MERGDVPGRVFVRAAAGRVDGAEVVVAQLPATRVWPVHSLHDAPVDGDVSLLGACRHQGVCVLERLCCCDGAEFCAVVFALTRRSHADSVCNTARDAEAAHVGLGIVSTKKVM